jgi:hypothetical protein
VVALAAAYPEYPWDPSKFPNHHSKGFWKNPENQRSVLEQTFPQLKDKTATVPLTTQKLLESGGHGLLTYHGSLRKGK